MSPQSITSSNQIAASPVGRPGPAATAKAAAPPANAPSTKSSISAAALAMAKEAAETPAQTALEAQGNDPQAQRLMAREAALHKAYG